MRVLNCVNPGNGLTEDPLYYMHFEDHVDDARDCYLFMADFYDALYGDDYRDKERVVLTLEEPNFCTSDRPRIVDLHNNADQILTLCSYTAELFDNRTAVFFPFNERYIPNSESKTVDVAYFGSYPTGYNWASYVDNVFSKYSYKIGSYTSGNMQRCSYESKIETLGKSKVAVVHNVCNVYGAHNRYTDFPGGDSNRALTHLDHNLLPQIKSRTFEAAFSGAVILCQKDHWNVIENFFTPEVDFLYFCDEEDLAKKIDLVLNDYSSFDSIRQNAFDKAVNNYTVKKFVEKFLS